MNYMSQHNAGWVLWVTFLLAIVLATLPMAHWAAPYRPAWVVLVLIYWCTGMPERIGVASGWTVGLILDVLGGGLLGQNALALTLLAYLSRRLYQQMRVYSVWQQSITVFLLVATYQVLMFWIKGITGQSPDSLAYWLPTFTSTLLWPLIYVVLQGLRHGFRVA